VVVNDINVALTNNAIETAKNPDGCTLEIQPVVSPLKIKKQKNETIKTKKLFHLICLKEISNTKKIGMKDTKTIGVKPVVGQENASNKPDKTDKDNPLTLLIILIIAKMINLNNQTQKISIYCK